MLAARDRGVAPESTRQTAPPSMHNRRTAGADAGVRRNAFRERAGPRAESGMATIPQRGLYTGVMVVGAVGTGRRRRAYFTRQLLRWRGEI